MCGIFGYLGPKSAANIVLEGLKRLEYRGYDSIGIATLDKSSIKHYCSVGKVSVLEEDIKSIALPGNIGIGHTRWATHGEPTKENAHPHHDCSNKVFIVHNGIIENYLELKVELEKDGHTFCSQTDSEVVAHLVEMYLSLKMTMMDAILKTASRLIGSYALCVVSEHEPGKLFAIKKSSPLMIGRNKDEFFFSSDVAPILKHTREVVYLDDNEMAILDYVKSSINVYDKKGKQVKKESVELNINIEDVEKGSYDYYMKKEIHEQPASIIRTFEGRCDVEKGDIRFFNLNISNNELVSMNRIVIVACGTSLHAGLVGEFFLEKFANTPVEVEYAAEFRYRNPIIDARTLVIAITQSGETADTLAAVDEAKNKGATVVAITNVPGSTVTREAHGVVFTRAGLEIGVASTKAFTAQIAALYMFSIYMARIKWVITAEVASHLIQELYNLPSLIEEVFLSEKHIRKIAEKYFKSSHYLYMGRGIGFPVALEGALKMKEISYIHAEGYSAAEMKHGPIALIDEKMPVVVIALKGRSYDKILSNISEVKARKGIVIAIATKGDKDIEALVDDVIYIPDTEEELTAILSVIPFQLLAYDTAVLRGCHVDQPRNLAKSVTVE
jgi:glutamine---fructose-6-phosphate transaminase (isomerizing)